MHAITLIIPLLAAVAPAAQPAASAPTTSKVIATDQMEPMSNGSIRYLPPPAAGGWKLVGKTDDNLKVTYATEDGKARLDINVSPQTRDVPDTYAKQMAIMIGKGIRDDADRTGR